MSSIFDAKCMWGLEKNTFKRHYADFIWMLLLGYVGTLIGCLCVPSYVYIGISMKFMVLYYWDSSKSLLPSEFVYDSTEINLSSLCTPYCRVFHVRQCNVKDHSF